MTPAQFKKLQATWYKKAAKAGHQEIEDLRGHNNVKDAHQSHFYKLKDNGLKVETTFEYYYYATHFGHEHNFETEGHRAIWLLHADGVSYRDIAKKKKKTLNEVYKIINKYRRIFKNVHFTTHDA